MKRRFVTACLSGLLLLSAATAQAGHGHHGHHGHGGWHIDFIYGGGFYPSPWYTPYYYYPPPPIVYAPQQVIVPLAQTSTPAPASAVVNIPAVPPPTVRSNVVPSYRGSGVTIRNPAASGANVAFVVDSRTEVELEPGNEIPLVQKGAYFVEFDRGGEFGTMKRTLTEGSYEFVVTPKGWDLQLAPTEGSSPTPTPVVRRNTLPTMR